MMNVIAKYFIRGIILILPLGLTALFVMTMVRWARKLLDVTHLHGWALAGVVVLSLALIAIVGFLGSTMLASPIKKLVESIIDRVPLVKFVYSSLKDVMGAVMGDKKKFDKPVLITFSETPLVKKPGFMTQADLEQMDLPGMVSVYLPHSYNFSGNVFIVEKKAVEALDVPGGEMMKFIVSGGVAGFHSEAETA